jgi:hypothetical protein
MRGRVGAARRCTGSRRWSACPPRALLLIVNSPEGKAFANVMRVGKQNTREAGEEHVVSVVHSTHTLGVAPSKGYVPVVVPCCVVSGAAPPSSSTSRIACTMPRTCDNKQPLAQRKQYSYAD